MQRHLEIGTLENRELKRPNGWYLPSGCVVPLITPLMSDQEGVHLDSGSLASLITYVAAEGKGVSCVFIAGGTGEFNTMPQDVRMSLINEATPAAHQQKLPVLVGVSAPTINEMRAYAIQATIAEADGVVINLLQGEGSPYQKMARLIACTSLPITVYEIPEKQEGRILDPEKYGPWLASLDQVVGIKVSTAREDVLAPWLKLASPGFHVLPGATTTLKFGLERGAAGFVPATANVYPVTFSWQALVDEKTNEVNRGALEYAIDLRRQLGTPAEIKEELVRRGVINSATMFTPK